jgi:hypothetical protein
MNEKEIMQWAIRGIDAEIKANNKRLKRELLVKQANEKGIETANFDRSKHEKRVADIRAYIELLSRKKAFLVVQIEERG